MTKKRIQELLNQVVALDNGRNIRVDNEIVPEVGTIQEINIGIERIQVHSVDDHSSGEKLRFSITQHPKTNAIRNLPVRIFTMVEGENIYSHRYGRLDAINDPLWYEYEVLIPKSPKPKFNEIDENLITPTPMDEWINEELMEFDFNRTPLTKELLRNYISCTYKENADYSEYSMRQELQALHEDNQLMLLFIQEKTDNPDIPFEDQ